MLSSGQIQDKIKKEQAVLSDFRTQLLLARAEAEKAEKTRQKVARSALSGGDAKAQKQLEEAEAILAAKDQRFKSIEAAIADSEKRQADLEAELIAAVNEERWLNNVIKPFEKELNVAAEIEKHFLAKDAKGPLTALLRSHLEALHTLTRFFAHFKINAVVPPASVFQRWFSAQMHGAPGFNADRFIRDRYAGSYVSALKREFDRISEQRETTKPKLQNAVNG